MNEKEKCHLQLWSAVGLTFLWLTVGLTFFGLILLTLRIDNIDEQLKDVPKRVCHVEEGTQKIELCGLKNNNSVCNFLSYDYNYYDTEPICEDDVVIYTGSRMVAYYGTGIKTCLLKSEKEVCEVV